MAPVDVASSGIRRRLTLALKWLVRFAGGSESGRRPVTGAEARAREARAAREYAATFARSDPRFMADLLAAADRHEGGDA
jgi:ribosomal protein S7